MSQHLTLRQNSENYKHPVQKLDSDNPINRESWNFSENRKYFLRNQSEEKMFTCCSVVLKTSITTSWYDVYVIISYNHVILIT